MKKAQEMSINDCVNQMNDEEAKRIIANLQRSYIPPYSIVTMTTMYVIKSVEIDEGSRVVTQGDRVREAYHVLKMARVKEIADVILQHPMLGEKVLRSMMDGHRVAMVVEKKDIKKGMSSDQPVADGQYLH